MRIDVRMYLVKTVFLVSKLFLIFFDLMNYMKNLLLFLILLISVKSFAQTKEMKYKIFDGEGNEKNISQIIDRIKNADVVFLGENHDDTVAHALQFEIFKTAVEKYGREKKVTLSMEMFERDVQTILNEYLNNLISEQHFLSSSRPWGNYKTDYRPLVELAKEKNLEVIAANAPRRYVNMVSRLGRESLEKLSPAAKNWIAPLPYGQASELYAAKFDALMGQMSDSNTPRKHSPILNSQSLWDATMAYSIAENLEKNEKSLIVHLNGAFHTENHLGTVEHLLKYRPKMKVLVVTMRYEDDFKTFDKLKHTDLGDFVILTDAKQPRSQT